jgi:hypothetical protein
MAAIQRTRISSFGAAAVIAGVAAVLIVVATGGHPVRATSAPVLVPAAAMVPDWVLSYGAPAQADGFKVDGLIENLSYEQPATAALPTWVERYLAPDQAPAFKVDTMLESLGYRQPGEGAGAQSDTTGLQP